jgi:hypothetical protein
MTSQNTLKSAQAGFTPLFEKQAPHNLCGACFLYKSCLDKQIKMVYNNCINIQR